MSYHPRQVMQEVTISEFHCDGPNHTGELILEPGSLEFANLTYKFDNPFKTSRADFCSKKCLADWAASL